MDNPGIVKCPFDQTETSFNHMFAMISQLFSNPILLETHVMNKGQVNYIGLTHTLEAANLMICDEKKFARIAKRVAIEYKFTVDNWKQSTSLHDIIFDFPLNS